ncbi:hypothetical protein CPB85DRAFT_1250803 [Mucidula mucida]|nr:hypothetical protein CPB85DRAFT_1250803 [Mucidula mucida]
MVRKSPALAVPGSKLETILPLNVSGPAVARVAYACRYQRRKAPGSLIVSVLVATLTMSSSIWAVFMLLTTAWVKRRDRQEVRVAPGSSECGGFWSLNMANKCWEESRQRAHPAGASTDLVEIRQVFERGNRRQTGSRLP